MVHLSPNEAFIKYIGSQVPDVRRFTTKLHSSRKADWLFASFNVKLK